jgi:copper chaperone CopZ
MTYAKQEATAILRIDGMSKSGRAERLKRAVHALDGVFLMDINYILDNVTISYDPNKLTLAQVKKKLNPGINSSVKSSN